eukprot:gb/GECG01007112.1/.p1 GENE.gb/GECG01007112.1/~~gb/GECG01007112.1/.p1  ORF type:complete len:391 (+),score=58.49 gb/GECG01007112.1/:1-1173(+)
MLTCQLGFSCICRTIPRRLGREIRKRMASDSSSPSTKSRPTEAGLILFDAHSHIQDDRCSSYIDEILGNAGKLGVGCIAINGTTPNDWERVAGFSSLPDLWHTHFVDHDAHHGDTNPLRKLKEDEKMSSAQASNVASNSVLPYIECDAPLLIPSFGVHPYKVEEALEFKDEDDGLNWKEFLEQLLLAHPYAGVGEIGIHHASGCADMEKQMDIFEQQLELAAEMKRPVSIHCVKAYGKLLEALKKYKPPKVLLHSYSGGTEMMQAFDRLEGVEVFYSFSGSISNENHKKARESVSVAPIEKLLIESDSPDQLPRNPLFPDSRLNEPASCRVVLDLVARLRSPFATGESLEIAEKHSHSFYEECVSLARNSFENAWYVMYMVWRLLTWLLI